MTRKPPPPPDDERSCCQRRALLRGLGAAGLLMLGRCTTAGGVPRPDHDRGLGPSPDTRPPDPDGTPVDTSFVGADGGLPPIDLAAPAVTEMATFALG